MNKDARIWGVALIISLMLNAFALGMIISDKLSARESGPRRMVAAGPPGLPPFGPGLPPKTRILFRDLRETRHKELEKRFEAIHAARTAVKQELEKESFDPATLEARLSELRTAEGEAAADAHRILLKVASTLNREERQSLADMILFHARGMPANVLMRRLSRPAQSEAGRVLRWRSNGEDEIEE